MKKLITLCTLLLCAVVTSWADDVYKLQLNGANVEYVNGEKTTGDAMTFFSYNSAKHNFNTKFNGCTYDGVSYTSGLKMEGATNLSWTTTTTSTIVIAQSTWSDKTIRFDGAELAVGDASTTVSGCRIYTIEDVEPGDHSVTRGSGESGVFAITVTAAAAVVDPVFSLTATSIGLDETSQIQVGAKGDLDGIALTGLASSDPTVATVDETGLITPLKVGTTTISFTASAAVAGKYNATSTTFSEELTVTAPKVATPVIAPADGAYFFGDNQSVTITCSTDGAAIQYSTDGGSSWNNYTGAFDISATTTILVKATKDGYTESAQASATINKLAPTELAAVGTATTWNWESWNEELQLTDGTTPNKNTTLTFSDIALINPINLPSGFNGDAITFKGQYPVRSKKSQAGTWTVKTTVAGRFEITFSDTGSSGAGVKRYLNVNGVNTEYYTQRDGSSDKKTVTLKLPAGTYAFTGMGEDEATSQAIVMYKIVYTPVEKAGGTIPESGFCTYSTNYPVDLSTITGGTAYIATGVADGKVTLEKCEAKVPAATGLLIAGTADDPFTINTTADATEAPAGNLLVGMPNGGVVPADKYVFAWTTGAPADAGFYKLDDVLADIGEFKAYLDYTAGGGARLSLSFGEDAGEATGISEMKSVKADGAIFNLRGQRVAQPQKGLYIMNGKKTIVK